MENINKSKDVESTEKNFRGTTKSGQVGKNRFNRKNLKKDDDSGKSLGGRAYPSTISDQESKASEPLPKENQVARFVDEGNPNSSSQTSIGNQDIEVTRNSQQRQGEYVIDESGKNSFAGEEEQLQEEENPQGYFTRQGTEKAKDRPASEFATSGEAGSDDWNRDYISGVTPAKQGNHNTQFGELEERPEANPNAASSSDLGYDKAARDTEEELEDDIESLDDESVEMDELDDEPEEEADEEDVEDDDRYKR